MNANSRNPLGKGLSALLGDDEDIFLASDKDVDNFVKNVLSAYTLKLLSSIAILLF